MDRDTDIFLASGSAISFPLVHTTTLGQPVHPDIALHFSNYYINIYLASQLLFIALKTRI
jgi:hypothetical protein